ncbi:MAG: YggS family pyridoxal phosphate-dependent enzyme [Treponema sp.]|nr:YggS family pyridoxal phosphate-dependent enzyme [Treponema sp.]
MAEYDFVAGRVEGLRERIAAACARSGRRPEEVELLAVTKFHPAEAVLAAYGAGLRSFGESRVQEAEAKLPSIRGELPGARLDMIGHLQGNKAKKAAALFDRVQSVDSVELARALGERARAAGRRIEILLELHTGEESKEGFESLDELQRGRDAVLECPALTLRGLMTMAPFGMDVAAVRSSFRKLRAAFELIRSDLAPGPGREAFDTLSMGMSGDFEQAVEEGSTLVRIGTALFGERSR